MEEKDYLMSEVEKIGLIINAIGQKIFGSKGNTAITLEDQIKDAKDMLFNGASFNIDEFLNLTVEDSNKYIYIVLLGLIMTILNFWQIIFFK